MTPHLNPIGGEDRNRNIGSTRECPASGCSAQLRPSTLYFGTDEVTFTVTSTNPNANPKSRTYASFTDAALDVVEARILQGIHTRSADLNGRHLGKSVAKWVFKNALRPLNPGSDDDDQDDQD